MSEKIYRATAMFVAVVCLSMASTANAADPAYMLSGRVTDESGIEPIAGAVVSLELRLSPDRNASKGAKLPTRLAVWQARTAADGTFSLPESTKSLTLPSGTALSDAFLKVFALAYAPYTSTKIKLNTQTTAQRQVRVLQTKGEIGIRLKLEPQDYPWITAQLNAMYNELHQGTGGDALPGGRQYALASYAPLLSLLATSCQQVEALSSKPLDMCQKAGKEFDLREAISKEVSFIRREPEPPAPVQEPATPALIKTSPPESPGQSAVKPPPPGS